MLHETVSRDHDVGVQLASILLDAGARLDIRDTLLMSTLLGWARELGIYYLLSLSSPYQVQLMYTRLRVD